MKTYLLILLIHVITLLQIPAYAQAWQWVKPGVASVNLSAGIDLSRQEVVGVEVDFLGNSVVGGNFESSTLNFDPLTLNGNFSGTPFLVKYNKSGVPVWVRKISNSPGIGGRRILSALTTDNNGNIYVTGYYNGSINFSSSIKLEDAALNGPVKSFFAKYDKDGNILWARNIGDGAISPLALSYTGDEVVITGKFKDSVVFDTQMFTTQLSNPSNLGNIFLTKFDLNGNFKWVKVLAGSDNNSGEDVEIDRMGNIFLAGVFSRELEFEDFTLSASLTKSHFVSKFSAEGKVQWAKIFNSSNYRNSLGTDKEGNVYLTGSCSKTFKVDDFEIINRGPDYSTSDVFISKINTDGRVEWINSYGSSANELGVNIVTDNGGNSYIVGFFNKEFEVEGDILKNVPATQYDYKFDLFLLKVDRNGKVRWTNSANLNLYQASFDHIKGLDITTDKVGNVNICGAYSNVGLFENIELPKASCNIFTARIVDADFVPPGSAFIQGNIFEDLNGNNVRDSYERGIADIILKAEPGPYYAISNSLGKFFMDVEPGAYTVAQILPVSKSKIIDQIYPQNSQPFNIDILESDKSHLLNFANQVTECSQLTVDIAADRRRRCFRSNTTVTYTNDGNVDAQNVRIKVIYPKYVVPISSARPWTAKLDSALVFDIGTVKAGERTSFVITDSTICGNESIRGLSQCIKAVITPKSTCEIPDRGWGKASVAVAGSFINQEQTAEFTIANRGVAAMSDSTSYRLFANTALIKEGKVKLGQGDSTTLEVPAQLVTYRLEADQVQNHPGNSRPTISLQPSIIPIASPVADVLTPVDAFYQDDADAEVDISCLTIIDSYDPNDKQVSPRGITSRNYIKAEDDLEYLIRFQNTGTDVAYKVVVKDTLSEHLDISSLRVRSASHPFTYSVSGKGNAVLTFTFEGINLPAAKVDELGSHGFIKFSIAQSPENPKGTVIRNTAYNYFDFNSPIATNEVVNIIGDTLIIPPTPAVVYDCSEEMPDIAQAGPGIHLCDASTTTLQANTPTKGSGKWVLVSGQATVVDPYSPTSKVQDIAYGETILEWTIKLCRNVSRAQVKINRFSIPSAPQITQLPLQCEGDILLPITATGDNITWYQDAEKQFKLFAGNNYVPVVSASTTFYATQTVNGCESPVSATVVGIHPNEVTITAINDTLVAPLADSYQWFFNDMPIAGGTAQKLFVRNSGQYRVRTITNGCESNSQNLKHTVKLPASVLSIAPNPVRDELFLEFASTGTGEVKIIVRDQLGKPVLSHTILKENTVLELVLQLEKLAPSVYFLDVQLNHEVHKAKVMKL